MPRVLIAGFVFSLLVVQIVESKPILPCASSATTAGGVLLVCPHGDGPTLADIGATIDITVMTGPWDEPFPYPSHAIPPTDIWVSPVGDYSYPYLCNGSYSINADDWLDENGRGTISGSIAASGYSSDPVYVMALGQAIQGHDDCDNPIPLVLVSPDINGDFVVDMGDFTLFSEALGSGNYDPRMDYNGDNVLDVGDFRMFADHYFHRCEH